MHLLTLMTVLLPSLADPPWDRWNSVDLFHCRVASADQIWLCQVHVPTAATAKRERVTAPAIGQPSVDFNHPPRDYVTHRLHGWSVLIEKQLTDASPELAKRALARLKVNLSRVAHALPSDALTKLKHLKIFLMFGSKASKGIR